MGQLEGDRDDVGGEHRVLAAAGDEGAQVGERQIRVFTARAMRPSAGVVYLHSAAMNARINVSENGSLSATRRLAEARGHIQPLA